MIKPLSPLFILITATFHLELKIEPWPDSRRLYERMMLRRRTSIERSREAGGPRPANAFQLVKEG